MEKNKNSSIICLGCENKQVLKLSAINCYFSYCELCNAMHIFQNNIFTYFETAISFQNNVYIVEYHIENKILNFFKLIDNKKRFFQTIRSSDIMPKSLEEIKRCLKLFILQ